MSVDLAFNIWANTGMVASAFGKVLCPVCSKRSMATFAKPLLCTRCKAVMSEYAAYLPKAVNTRIIYYSNIKGSLHD